MSGQSRKETAGKLSVLLADSYLVYLKTQNFHWNVTGPQFFALHELFEQQYTDLAAAIDVIAERIRALDEFAPGSFGTFKELSDIEEATDVPSSENMVKTLAKDNESLAQACRDILASLDDSVDEATIDLATERLRQHEQNTWMLRSSV